MAKLVVEAEAAVRPISERTAIVHDWFAGLYGSEQVVEAIRTGLFAPGNQPDIFTFQAACEVLPAELSGRIVRQSRLARLPGIRQRGYDPGHWRLLLPYMPTYFRRLRLDDYDLVISSSHACAHHVQPRADAFHVVYCHTPMRYVWMPDVEQGRARGLKGAALGLLRGRLRRADVEAARRPNLYVANSQAVRERIRRFYARDAVVIHPPVDLDGLDATREKEPGLFLWAHRLVSYKHPAVVMEAFRGLPSYRLVMVGVGPLAATLRRNLPPNVELRGWVDRAELAELYARASGFIHVAEEDFGMTMVEALASGTPVIAARRGGAPEILRNGVDGLLLDEADPAVLRQAVESMAAAEWRPALLAERARAFSRERFLRELSTTIADRLAA